MTYHEVRWPEPETLTRLVRDAQGGHPAALDRLLATLRPPLLAYFTHRLTSDHAEDLAQTVLVRVAGALSRIDPGRANAYITTVARNLLRTAYRERAREGRRYVPLELANLAANELDADAAAEYEELARAVRRLSAAMLPPELADLVLGLLRGDTPAEIAARQHVSPITIRTRLLRVRAILRRELRAYLDDPTSQAHTDRPPDHRSAG